MKPVKLSPVFRVCLVIAAALLGMVHFFPLWKISLWAPQYPEGLNMFIWSSHLSGDVQTVSTLNHYIGMAPIHQDAFAEMKYFPLIFDGLAVWALLTAVIGRRELFFGWVAGLAGFSLWSLYDFWAWEYKFGHELSADAPMSMEGMVYQPPLIGEKQFLNVTATSWPDWAGLAFAIVVTGAVVTAIVMFMRRSNMRMP